MDITWKALADPVRRDILDLLREEARTTGDLCEAFGHLTRFSVMNHMAVLKEAGFVRVEHRGRERINHLDAEPLREAYENWIRNYEVLWAGRLGRLKKFVEGKESQVVMPQNDLPMATLVTLEIEQQIELKASPAEVFRAITLDIGEWWGHPYLREDARDIVLEPVPGGLMKQITRDGGGNVMCAVQAVRRDHLLRLNGTMGMPDAVFGTIQFELEAIGERKTRLRLTHWALGNLSSATKDDFTTGWKDLLDTRLRAFVEGGEARGVRATQ